MLEKILEKVTRLEKLLIKEEAAPKWVKMSTVMRELGKGRSWVTEQRKKDEFIARKMHSGRYEYNLTAYKKIAI